MMLRILAPCRLGEKFEHTKSYGYSKPQFFVGLDFFAWHCCGFEGFTVRGNTVPHIGGGPDYFHLEHLVNPPISFEVPYAIVRGDEGVPMREFGLDSEKKGWLGGLYLDKDGGWHYNISKGDQSTYLQVRTEALDKLFAPILPAVKLSAADFL